MGNHRKIEKSGEIPKHVVVPEQAPGGRQVGKGQGARSRTAKKTAGSRVVQGQQKPLEGRVVASTPKESMAEPAVPVEELRGALEVFIELEKINDPNFEVSDKRFEGLLANMVARTPEEQKQFLEGVRVLVEQNEKLQEWGPWLASGAYWVLTAGYAKPLAERAATHYREGLRQLVFASYATSTFVEFTFAAVSYQFTSEGAIGGSVVGKAIGGAVNTFITPMVNWVMQSLPFVVEFGVRFCNEINPYDANNNPEGVTEEAKKLADAVAINVGSISSEEAGALGEKTIGIWQEWTSEDVKDRTDPVSYVASLVKKFNGNVGNVVGELLGGGGRMELLEIFLTVILMGEFGVKPLSTKVGLEPITYPPSVIAQHSWKAMMISTFVGVAVKCLVVAFKGENINVKKMLTKFFIKGPLSMKVIGAAGAAETFKKGVAGALNPVLALVMWSVISKFSGNMLSTVKGVWKDIIRTTLGALGSLGSSLLEGMDRASAQADRIAGLGEEHKKRQEMPAGLRRHMEQKKKAEQGK